MGSDKLWFQYWFPQAVKINGAVSPATLARASNTPVMIPLSAVRMTMWTMARHWVMPRAEAASR